MLNFVALEASWVALGGHFRIILGSSWDYFGVTVGSRWAYFRMILVHVCYDAA